MIRWVYRAPVVGKLILRILVRLEGGEKSSYTLRQYTEDYYRVKVGLYTYGSCFDKNFNTGGKLVEIGSYCSFAHNVRYFGADHPISHATMSPYFYNKSFCGQNVNDVERNKLTIGNDVWIGYGATILSGCKKIGNGAIIGAGAIVTKDVQPYSIVVGNPAREIRKRFDINVIEHLERSEWWLYEPTKLYKVYDYIDNPIKWVEKLKDLDK